MTSGIYKITNSLNGKYYFGSSVDIEKRWAQHRASLNKAIHHSQALQRAWNKYGEKSFEFSILKELPKNKGILLFFEQHYLDLYFGSNCYNIYKIAGSPLGFKHSEEFKKNKSRSCLGRLNPFYGKHFSEESKKKLSDSLIGKLSGEKHPLYGSIRSEETKEKISKVMSEKMGGEKNSNSKLTWSQVREIRSSSLSRKDLKDCYGISSSCLGKILRNELWKEEL